MPRSPPPPRGDAGGPFGPSHGPGLRERVRLNPVTPDPEVSSKKLFFILIEKKVILFLLLNFLFLMSEFEDVMKKAVTFYRDIKLKKEQL